MAFFDSSLETSSRCSPILKGPPSDFFEPVLVFRSDLLQFLKNCSMREWSIPFLSADFTAGRCPATLPTFHSDSLSRPCVKASAFPGRRSLLTNFRRDFNHFTDVSAFCFDRLLETVRDPRAFRRCSSEWSPRSRTSPKRRSKQKAETSVKCWISAKILLSELRRSWKTSFNNTDAIKNGMEGLERRWTATCVKSAERKGKIILASENSSRTGEDQSGHEELARRKSRPWPFQELEKQPGWSFQGRIEETPLRKPEINLWWYRGRTNRWSR